MTSHANGPTLVLPVGPRDHAKGPAHAPVTLVEYGDFECPQCGRAHPIVRSIQRALGDRLRFVFRHFPMSEAHPNAQNAAEAAEAAGAQGKFWEMHDELFDHQEALEPADLIAHAKRLGLDPETVRVALERHSHAARVREDFTSGARSGVNGTPTFFLNGRRYDGEWDRRPLLAAIEEILQAAVE